MAIDLTGISNENEYYTHHYLSAILESDLKNLFEKWTERKEKEGVNAPFTKLAALAREYFVLKNKMERTKGTANLLNIQRKFTPVLMDALGYTFSPGTRELDDGILLPVIGEIKRSSGEPQLWVLEAVAPAAESEDALLLNFDPAQYGDVDKSLMLLDEEISEIVTRRIFTLSEPPRWVILISFDSIVLLDRTKWNEKRLLRFDLPEIIARKEPSTFRAMAALLHRESVCPQEGTSLLDTLDENSHKHAFSVSEDLKYSAREAVELLGNEAVHYIRYVRKEIVFGTPVDAQQLTLECLRYLYRLLFMFYVEARPELKYAPMGSDEYRMGYSLESLRDLELVPLTTDESKNGFFIHESLQTLFRLVFNGYNHADQQLELGPENKPLHHTFRITPLNSHLFDPDNTKTLNKVKFRNSTLQRVIELLSLSRPKGNRDRRGRISYAQLGINQLGAVYEGLLSYSGFFAEADLYEVKRADKQYDELDAAYFVKADDLPKYETDEKVHNSDGTLKKYEKGTFIYRLAGRTREKSASYYTPEVLTRCLVKYALKELLKDKTADDILQLKVCEMALGSGAFANEVVNQLSEAYLQLMQKELGKTIGHDEYGREKQKVKMFIADNNVFGVDLNPVAVELAEISLWLNTLYEGAYVPWFGMQLVAGNSLIGARRQVFPSDKLMKRNRGDQTWLDLVPDRVPLSSLRSPESVYHFLLPDTGMADYNDKVIRELAPDEIKKIKAWRKQFIRPFSEGEVETLERLSTAVDKLWERHVEKQRQIRARTTDLFPVFGQEGKIPKSPPTTTHQKDQIHRQEFLSLDVRNSSPYRRLKLAMDYWCSLWFWPIEKADMLPTRDEYLMELTMLLEGTVYETATAVGETIPIFATTTPVDEQKKMIDELGFVNVDKLCKEFPRLALVEDMKESYRFHHWELEYADLFYDRVGFDLMVGNPPWIKIEWNEGGLLGDYEPLFLMRKLSASEATKTRQDTIKKRGIRSEYLGEYVEMTAAQNFVNAKQNYPLLQGTQSNLYKCFLPQAWDLSNRHGISGFLHPDGVYDDPNAGEFRAEIYPRLRVHFQFQNEFKLFAEVHNETIFGVNIYAGQKSETVDFTNLANVFVVPTIEQCFASSSMRPLGGIKDENNKWNTAGHPDRLVTIDEASLELFARLYDMKGTPARQARLPVLHSRHLLAVLRKFAVYPQRLDDLQSEFDSTEMWHETNAQKDGTIRRKTQFPTQLEDWIVSGPHFHVGNPYHQTPEEVCETNRAYEKIDVTELPDNFLPRTNYVLGCDPITYRNRTATVKWDGTPTTNRYRLIFRGMLSQAGERTLTGCILPPRAGHINGVQSTSFKNLSLLVTCASLSHSIVADFFIKSTGRGNLHYTWQSLPLLQVSGPALLNTLALNCLTSHYAELWAESWTESFVRGRWAKADPRLDDGFFAQLTPEWHRNCALRTDYARRQALVEIDVHVAQALSLTLDELCAIYRIQFPVLRQNENDTWYDQNGRIVFTCSKGLPGVGFSRPEWEKIKDMKEGTVQRTISDDTMPGGPRERTITYTTPFDKCDREEDYALAWREFEKRLGK
jgi:hypothetical protein